MNMLTWIHGFKFLPCSKFRFQEVARQSKTELVSLGFPEFTIEDFHETVSIILKCC